MKNDLVVKDNALINASYSLGLVEQRLILLAIVAIREHAHRNHLDHISCNKPVEITAESYIKAFGVHPNTAYTALKDACKTLFARQFSYQEPRAKGVANVTTRWVQKIAYIETMATVEISFSDDVLPLITYLEKQLTSYELKQVASLTSGYAIRLYELLIAWRSVGKTPEITIDEFRKKMGVLSTEHPRIDNLKRRVIDPAIAQVNEHTDITAEYEQHKQGRSIVAFSFRFKEKSKPKKAKNERDPRTVDWVNGVSDNEIKGMTASQAIKYAEKLHRKHEIVGDWSDCKDYEQTKSKLIKLLQQPQHVREYMQFLLECDEPFDPKTIGFK